MKKKQIILGSLFLALVICSFVFRVIDYIVFGGGVLIQQSVYQNAIVMHQGVHQVTFSVAGVYTAFLALIMNFIGEGEVAGICVNMILQTLTVVFTFFSLQKMWNVYISFLTALILSVALLIMGKMYVISVYNIYIVLVMAIAWIVVCILEKIFSNEKIQNKAAASKLSAPQKTKSKVITLDDILGSSTEETTENRKNMVEEIEKKDTQMVDMENDETTTTLPVGMKEIHLKDLERKVQFIENPLPTPKRREHKEMDFAVEIAEDDNFDITDMTGMDYYDIE